MDGADRRGLALTQVCADDVGAAVRHIAVLAHFYLVFCAAEAVAGLKDSELARAIEVWRRRFDAPATDQKERARQARFLMARGFSGAVVAKVLRGAFDPESEADAGDRTGFDD